MPSIKDIKNRINSVSDTRKITNAMYLIASTKLRKEKSELEATKPYFESLKTEIKRVFRTVEETESIFFYDDEKKVKNFSEDDSRYAFLVITADKGLAGAYNQSVIKQTMELLKQHPNSLLYVVGEVGRNYFNSHGISYEQSFLYTAQNPSIRRADVIADILLEKYVNREISKIYIIYTDMKNSLSSEVNVFRLLPLHKAEFVNHREEAPIKNEFEYVSSFKSVLESIVPGYISGFVYSALVDSFCAEQNARMLAMDMANKNAEELLEQLKKQYNHLRQNAITREITEVAAGAKSKKKKRSQKKCLAR